MIDLAGGTVRGWDGVADEVINFGFIGVRERPVAADMDQDGFDDLALWVPDREGVTDGEESEWFFLISGGASLLDRLSPQDDPINSYPTIDFSPWPFGDDRHAQFGDDHALPIVGNFDPPTVSLEVEAAGHTNPANSLDVSDDGYVTPRDSLLVINDLNEHGSRELLVRRAGAPYLDVSGDGYVTPRDSLLVLNELNDRAAAAARAAIPAGNAAADMASAVLADEAFGQPTAWHEPSGSTELDVSSDQGQNEARIRAADLPMDDGTPATPEAWDEAVVSLVNEADGLGTAQE
jgi:hypothetical protein